jgi:hypothetical protein
MSKTSSSGSGGGGCGCFSAILVIVALWALCFGVTIDGKHYGLSGCDTQKGVVIDR